MDVLYCLYVVSVCNPLPYVCKREERERKKEFKEITKLHNMKFELKITDFSNSHTFHILNFIITGIFILFSFIDFLDLLYLSFSFSKIPNNLAYKTGVL